MNIAGTPFERRVPQITATFKPPSDAFTNTNYACSRISSLTAPRQQCHITSLQYALTCVATVVSRPAADRAVIDAGRKTLNKEIQMPLVAGRDDIQVTRLSAEHGDLHLDPSARDLKIGDRLELIPGYADLTVNLHDEIYGFRHGRLEVIFPIAARGKVQ